MTKFYFAPASVSSAQWTPPLGGVPGMSRRKETLGKIPGNVGVTMSLCRAGNALGSKFKERPPQDYIIAMRLGGVPVSPLSQNKSDFVWSDKRHMNQRMALFLQYSICFRQLLRCQ